MGGEDHKIGWHLHKAIFRGDLTGEFISKAQYKVYVMASWGLLIFGAVFFVLALWPILIIISGR